MKHTYEQISLTLREELNNMKPGLRDFDDADLFMDDLGLDSLDLAEFVARIELSYRIEIDDAAWKSLISIQTSAEYLSNRFYAVSSL